jgi:TPR repeat protein
MLMPNALSVIFTPKATECRKTIAKQLSGTAEKSNDAAQAKLGLMYEIGKGVPQDYVQAYLWFDLAASQTFSGVGPFAVATSGIESAFHQAAAKARDRVAAKMTPEELAETQKLAREWSPGRH